MSKMDKIEIPPMLKLFIQIAALLITGTGAVANLKGDIANAQSSIAAVQADVAGVRQEVLDTQADVSTVNRRVDNLTNDLLGKP